MAIESLVSGGCIVSGSAWRSVLFSQVRVHSYSQVNESVLLPGVEVERGARLTRVVADRDCRIPAGMVIGEDPVADAKRAWSPAPMLGLA
jgi:glucose-1-phosphate adenylyltransferase